MLVTRLSGLVIPPVRGSGHVLLALSQELACPAVRIKDSHSSAQGSVSRPPSRCVGHAICSLGVTDTAKGKSGLVVQALTKVCSNLHSGMQLTGWALGQLLSLSLTYLVGLLWGYSGGAPWRKGSIEMFQIMAPLVCAAPERASGGERLYIKGSIWRIIP